MPTYEYRCKDCGTHLEVVQSFTDDALTACETCGGELRKVFGSVGISFKGSGFYKNDSRSGSGSKSSSSAGDNGSSSSTDGGSSSSSESKGSESTATSDKKSEKKADAKSDKKPDKKSTPAASSS